MVVAGGLWAHSCAMNRHRDLYCWGLHSSTGTEPQGAELASAVPSLVAWPVD